MTTPLLDPFADPAVNPAADPPADPAATDAGVEPAGFDAGEDTAFDPSFGGVEATERFGTDLVPLAGPLCRAADAPVTELVAVLRSGIADAYHARLSPDTWETYRGGWVDYIEFVEFLRSTGEPAPVMPAFAGDTAHLVTLAMWMVWCVTQRQVAYRCKDGTERVKGTGIAWSTVMTRLSGVVHELVRRGAPNPRDDSRFRGIERGLARTHNRPPTKVCALTASLLKTVIDVTRRPSPSGPRDEALIVLTHANVAAARLGRLAWEHIELTDTAATIGSGRYTLVLAATPLSPDLCPVWALTRWRDHLGGPTHGPVFAALDSAGRVAVRADGTTRASTKRALVWRVRAAAAAAGLSVPVAVSLPDLSDPAAARAALDAVRRPALGAVRDRAVLTVGLSVGSRRRNLSEFVVADATIVEEGLLLRFRRSKTDQDGKIGRVADVGRVGGRYCPVALIEEWLARYADALGRPLRPDDPLFCRIDRYGAPVLDAAGDPVRLARAAFSDIVETRATAAGLAGRFRSHSLRAGLATTLARSDQPLHVIAKRGGWKSLDVVLGYIEEAKRFDLNVADLLSLGQAGGP